MADDRRECRVGTTRCRGGRRRLDAFARPPREHSEPVVHRVRRRPCRRPRRSDILRAGVRRAEIRNLRRPFMVLTIRAATGDDLEAILDIYNDVIATTTAVFTYAPHTIAMRREWFDDKQRGGYPVLVADADGVVGFATYGPFRAWPAYKYSVEHSVHVAAPARGAGVGRALMMRLLEEARRQQYHAVVAGIVADNVASLRLHESLGFVEAGHFQEAGFTFGKWLGLKFLE